MVAITDTSDTRVPRSGDIWRDNTGTHVKPDANFLAVLVTNAACQAPFQKNEFICFGLFLPGKMRAFVHALSFPIGRKIIRASNI